MRACMPHAACAPPRMLISPQRCVSARHSPWRCHSGGFAAAVVDRTLIVARVLWSIPAGGPLSSPLRCCGSLPFELLTGQWRVQREYCSARLPHSSLVCRVRTRPTVSSAEYGNAIPLRVGWTGTDSGLQRAQRSVFPLESAAVHAALLP
jgi:hypothetical protein